MYMGGRWYFLWPRCDDGSCCAVSSLFFFFFWRLLFELVFRFLRRMAKPADNKSNLLSAQSLRSWFLWLLHSNFLGGSSVLVVGVRRLQGQAQKRVSDHSFWLWLPAFYLLLIFCGGGGGSCWQVRALIKWPASQQKKKCKEKENTFTRYRNAGADVAHVRRSFVLRTGSWDLSPSRVSCTLPDLASAPFLVKSLPHATCARCPIIHGVAICAMFSIPFLGVVSRLSQLQSQPTTCCPE